LGIQVPGPRNLFSLESSVLICCHYEASVFLSVEYQISGPAGTMRLVTLKVLNGTEAMK
jgi:hypothetical protein